MPVPLFVCARLIACLIKKSDFPFVIYQFPFAIPALPSASRLEKGTCAPGARGGQVRFLNDARKSFTVLYFCFTLFPFPFSPVSSLPVLSEA
jgi:hypothetical protein